MRRQIISWVIVLAIFALIALLAVGTARERDRSILPDREVSLEFGSTQKQYLREHDHVTVYVTGELAYLLGDGRQGYLQEYMNRILKPADLTAVFVTDEAEKADARLEVITQQRRLHHEGLRFTSPLFQMEGIFFLREDAAAGKKVEAVVMPDRMYGSELGELVCRDKPVSCRVAGSAGEAAAKAMADRVSIIGDRSTVISVLREEGAEQLYTPEETELYRMNVCLLVPQESGAVYEILNQCIHGGDRHGISYEASQRWLGGDGPVYMKRTNSNTWLPAVIIFLSVLIAFFVYYMANRNMYRELDERMDRLKASEKELQTTFHGVGHFLAELTLEGTVIDMNRAFAEDAGLSVMGRKIWETMKGLSEEDRRRVIHKVEEGARGHETERIETKIGRRIFVVDIFPIEDARGVTDKLLFMAIDVTQERMAKRQMLQDNKMIAIGQLAAGIAHEIRNPLGIIRNYCYVLKNMDDPELRAKAIGEIEQAVESSGAIINNLLDLSRISAGRVRKIDVEEHVDRILALNDSTFRKENILLRTFCEEPIITWIALEPFDMILLNLTSNAADAMKGGGDLIIRLIRGEEDFIMEVTDTGTGIEADALEEIFNPFYTTKGSRGTGLGLFIVYNEVEKLEGEIDVSSTPGEGTTFRVKLPIRTDPPEMAGKEEG